MDVQFVFQECGQTYEAIVDAAGTAFAVNLDTDITISDFTLNSNDATVDHVNSEFRVLNSTDLIAGRFNVKGGVIVGGIWNLADGVLKFNNNSNNRISGVTLQGALDLDTSSAFVRLQNGAVFTGDANVSGSSVVLAIEQTTTLDNKIINVTGSSATLGVSGEHTLTARSQCAGEPCQQQHASEQ